MAVSTSKSPAARSGGLTKIAESPSFYIGQRFSYRGALGTVRYVGDVEGVKHTWLGVEWDDPTRGKHSGMHNDKVYFHCIDPHPTAASFIRAESKLDQPVGFMQAVHRKYAPDDGSHAANNSAMDEPLQISGKVVEEVGFDKIRERQSVLTELRIVVLDGACVAGLGPEPWPLDQDLEDWEKVHEDYICRYGRVQMPHVYELDLSRNVLELWTDVIGICVGLPLKVLKLNGNRFRNLDTPPQLEPSIISVFGSIEELYLDNTLLSWEQASVIVIRVLRLTTPFHSLKTLSIASNLYINRIPISLNTLSLSTLNLSFNAFDCLTCIGQLACLSNLQTLMLHGNEISKLTCDPSINPLPVFQSLLTIDLSSNNISSFNFISHLPTILPHLTSLHISHNPLFSNLSTEESHLLTLARIATLQTLNYSPISPAERTNGELYYLHRLGADLSAAPAAHEAAILADHPRYTELCALHGPPAINRDASLANPSANTLGARLVTFSFYRPAEATSDDGAETAVLKTLTRPRSVSVYFLKAEVGALFALPPMHVRLVWETGEWDPVGRALGPEDDEFWSVGSDDEEKEEEEEEEEEEEQSADVEADFEMGSAARADGREQGKWVRRKVELLDGTREVGFWIEGREARVRVEYREKTW
ncbi:hypothetical protein MMC13_004666 [Lambiella insularis]|nr:hypothetical protein [Lambiella insularis]